MREGGKNKKRTRAPTTSFVKARRDFVHVCYRYLFFEVSLERISLKELFIFYIDLLLIDSSRTVATHQSTTSQCLQIKLPITCHVSSDY